MQRSTLACVRPARCVVSGRVLVARIAAIALGLVASAAEPESGSLSWSAPTECPDGAWIRAKIDEAGGLGGLAVAAEVRRDGDRWAATLELAYDGTRDTRTLEGETCEAIGDAAVLLIAVRRDEVAQSPKPEPDPADDAVESDLLQLPEPDPAPKTSSEDESASGSPLESPSNATEWRRPILWLLPQGLWLSAGFGVGLGAAPFPNFPLDLGLGLSGQRWRAGLRGRYHASTPVRVDPLGDARVHVGMASAEGCGRLAVARFEFPICAAVSLGGSRSAAFATGLRDRGGIWVDAGIQLGAHWYWSATWALLARLEGAAVIVGSGYAVGTTRVFVPSAVHGRLVVGIEKHFRIQFGPRPEKR